MSPIFRYRSALPMHIWTGYDLNDDGVNNDIYTEAYQFVRPRLERRADLRRRSATCTTSIAAAARRSRLQPARVEGVRPSEEHEARGDRRDLQPVQRDEPELGRGCAISSGRHLHGHGCGTGSQRRFMVPTATPAIRGQHRAAHRPDRVPVYVLGRLRALGFRPSLAGWAWPGRGGEHARHPVLVRARRLARAYAERAGESRVPRARRYFRP